MGTINQHWYSLNEGIAYPVDEAATAIDDAGNRLPSAILVDLSLRWPVDLGRYAFLSSVTVSPGAVTVTIQANDALDGSGPFQPLAVLTVARPVDQGRLYTLQPQLPGVGGWVAFGGGTEDRPYSGRFAAPTQSLLTSRAARSYVAPPVTGIRAMGAAVPLTGLVRLRASGPLAIGHEERDIEGVLRNCIVIRLVDDSGGTGTSVFESFAGPCGGRPESGSCGDPQPIEFIDSVGPDCDGTITVQLAGCAAPIPGDEDGLVAVACALGLGDACPPLRIPTSAGDLPLGGLAGGGYPHYVFTPPTSAEPLLPAHGSVGGSAFQECFAAVDISGVDGIQQVGSWDLVSDASDLWRDCPDSMLRALESTTAASRCVFTHSSFGYGLDGRRCQADIKLTEGPRGARHAAQVIFGYQERVEFSDQHVYYVAEADYDRQRLVIFWFNGSTFQRLESVGAPGIQLYRWYRLSIETGAGDFGPDTITARLDSLEDMALSVEVSAAPLERYSVTLGLSGVATSRSISRFSVMLSIGI